MERIMNREVRKYLYTVTIALVAVLVAYDVISGESAPLWLGLAAAVLGILAPATALGHMNPTEDDYTHNHEIDIEGKA